MEILVIPEPFFCLFVSEGFKSLNLIITVSQQWHYIRVAATLTAPAARHSLSTLCERVVLSPPFMYTEVRLQETQVFAGCCNLVQALQSRL